MAKQGRIERFLAGGVLPQDRQRFILECLARQGRVSAIELAQRFETSEDSIRRDLRELAAAGLCQRVYGGAVVNTVTMTPIAERDTHLLARKEKLAQAALSLLKRGQVLLIDAGSTNTVLARNLPEHHELTVITNAPAVALAAMGRAGTAVMLIGGCIDTVIGGTVGAGAVMDIQKVHADLCFIGACSANASRGIEGLHAEESIVKREMVRRSTEVATIVTNDKLGNQAPYEVAPISELSHIVVEPDASDIQIQAFRDCQVNVVVTA